MAVAKNKGGRTGVGLRSRDEGGTAKAGMLESAPARKSAASPPAPLIFVLVPVGGVGLETGAGTASCASRLHAERTG